MPDVELASLAIKIDSSDTEQGVKALDKLVDSGAKAEAAIKKVGSAAKDAGSQARSGAADHAKLGDAVADLSDKYGLNRAQVQELTAVARHSFDQMAAGSSIFQVLGTHVASLAELVGMGEGGLGGALAAMGGVGGVAAIAGISAVAGVTISAIVAAKQYSDAIQQQNVVVVGLGRAAGVSAQQLEDAAQSAARHSDQSIVATRSQASAFAAAGIEGADTISKLSAVTADYATLTGEKTVDAQKALAAALADPAKGVDDLNSKLGFLSASQVEAIKDMADFGDKAGAGATLTAALSANVHSAAIAAGGLSTQMGNLANAAQNVWNWYGKVNERLAQFQLFGFGGPPKSLSDQATALQLTTKLNNASVAGGVVADTTPEGQDAAQLKSLRQNVLSLQQGITASSALGDTQAVATQTAALGDYTRALTTYVPAAQKAHQEAVLEAQIAGTTDKAEKGRLTTQLALVKSAGQVMSSQDAQTRATDAGRIAADKATKSHDGHAQSLARDAASIIVNTNASLDAAQAYLKSATAGDAAEAKRKALTAATKDGLSPAQALAKVTSEQALADAQAIEASAKAATSLADQATARQHYNDMVAAGSMTSSAANDALAIENKLRPEEQRLLTLSGRAHDVLAAAIAKERQALVDLSVADKAAQMASDAQGQKDRIDYLQREYDLIGASNVERARQLAILQETQKLTANGQINLPGAQDLVVGAGKIGALGAQTTAAVDNYNKSLSYTADLLSEVDARAQVMSQALSSAFGTSGQALGDLLAASTSYAAQTARIEEQRKADVLAAGGDAQRLAQIEALSSQASATAELKHYSDVLTAMRGFFKEGSAGYKALTAAAQIYAAIQLANSFKTGSLTGAAGASGSGGIINSLGGLLGLGGAAGTGGAASAIAAGSAFSSAAVGATSFTSAASVSAAAAGGGGILGSLGGIGAALASNPIGWGIAAVGAVGSLFGLFGKSSDKAAKQAAAAQAAEEALTAARNAATAASDRAAAVEKERTDLEVQLLQLQGNATGALALQRQQELAALDASNRALQQQVYTWTDYNTALDAANQAVTDAQTGVDTARSALTDAYQREADAITSTQSTMQGFVDTLKAFNDNLNTSSDTALSLTDQRRAARALLDNTAASAQTGDQAALGNLTSVSQQYLAVAKQTDRTALDYARDTAYVRAAVQATEDYAGSQVSVAEQQLDSLKASVSGLIDVNGSVLSVRDAINNLAAAQGALSAAQAAQIAVVATKPDASAAPATPDWSVGGALWNQLATTQGAANAAAGNIGDVVTANWARAPQLFYEQYVDAQAAGSLSALDAAFQLSPGTAASFADRYGLQKFAMGGAVTSPTVGLFGEAGPEAVMPLTRAANGKLGVQASNDNSSAALLAEVQALRAEMARMRDDTKNIARDTGKMETLLQNVTEGGRAMQTEAAAS